MSRCGTCGGPNCGNCLNCHNPDCKHGTTFSTDSRGQCKYKGKQIPIRKSAFDMAWSVVKGKKLICSECDEPEGDGSCSECLEQQREEGRYEELWDE